MSAEAPQLGRVVRPAVEQDEQLQDLFERFARPLERFCMRALGNHEEAEDAVQTTFLNAFRAFRRGVRPELESAWLYSIATNVCRSRRRSSSRRRRVECDGDLDALEDVLAAPAPLEPEALMGLGDALAAMPESQRTAILLREWQGLSYTEIANELGMTHTAVETLIFRARKSLAKGLGAEQPRRRRAVGGLNLGSLVSALKGLLGGAGAAKLGVVGAVIVVAGVAAVPQTQHGALAAAGHRTFQVAARQSAHVAVTSAARETAVPAGAHPHRNRLLAQTARGRTPAASVVHSLLTTGAPEARTATSSGPFQGAVTGAPALGTRSSATAKPGGLAKNGATATSPLLGGQPLNATDVVTGTVDATAGGVQNDVDAAEATAQAATSAATDATAAVPSTVGAATTTAAGVATAATGAVATAAATTIGSRR